MHLLVSVCWVSLPLGGLKILQKKLKAISRQYVTGINTSQITACINTQFFHKIYSPTAWISFGLGVVKTTHSRVYIPIASSKPRMLRITFVGPILGSSNKYQPNQWAVISVVIGLWKKSLTTNDPSTLNTLWSNFQWRLGSRRARD